jgi:hypothetical protein
VSLGHFPESVLLTKYVEYQWFPLNKNDDFSSSDFIAKDQIIATSSMSALPLEVNKSRKYFSIYSAKAC